MSEKELLFSVALKDCKVDTFSSGGPGGQNVNRRSTGIRITHEPSGAVGKSTEERSQLQNKKTAFRRMVETSQFKWWVVQEQRRLETGKTAEDRVEEWMVPENIRTEYREDGKWVEHGN